MNYKLQRKKFNKLVTLFCLVISTFYFIGSTTLEADSVLPVRNFKVWQHSEVKNYHVSAANVGDALDLLNVEYLPIKVYPPVKTELKEGMMINVLSARDKVKETILAVPYKVERKADDNLSIGETRTVVEGVEGEKKVVTRYIKVGKLEVKKVIYEAITKEPISKVLRYGTAANILKTSRGNIRYKKVMNVEATAYTIAEGNGDGVTSIGIVPYRGIIAVDPSVVPYGTRVYVPGYGLAMAGDTGGAIVNNRIDCFMESYDEAIQFGRRHIKMYILE